MSRDAPRAIPLTLPLFDEAESRAVRECLDSRWVTQGPRVRQFEEMFARYHQVAHALATTSCTSALHLATMALGLGPGDEVVVPAFTWVTSAHCAEYVGAKAVFCDVDIATYNLDPASLRAALSPRTRAVIAVHLFGLAAPMAEVREVTEARGIRLVEDAACAVGTRYDGTPVGAIGDVACFSFHPRKVITTGEGGMVTTRHPEIAEKVASLRNHGTAVEAAPAPPARPWTMGRFEMLGHNLRLSDIQAAIGIAQMGKVDGLLAERLGRAQRYQEALDGVDELARPVVPPRTSHTFQTYVVRLREGGRERRNGVMEVLQRDGIQTRPGTHAVHRLGYYARRYGLRPEDFPNASRAEDTTIALPIFPGMTDEDQDRVVSSLRAGLAEGAR